MLPTNTETEARGSTLSLTFNIVSEVPVSVIRQEKKIRRSWKGKIGLYAQMTRSCIQPLYYNTELNLRTEFWVKQKRIALLLHQAKGVNALKTVSPLERAVKLYSNGSKTA